MYLDAPGTIIACAVDDTLHVTAAVGIAAYKAGGIRTFTVAIDNEVCPGGCFRSTLGCCGQTAIGGVHQTGTVGDGNLDAQGILEDGTAFVDNGCLQTLAGKDGRSI